MNAPALHGKVVLVTGAGLGLGGSIAQAMAQQGASLVICDVDLNALHSKRLQLFGVSNKMRTTAHRVAAAQALERDLLPMLADGRVTPWVDQVFAFDDLPAAQLCMQANRHLGKLVVRVD